MNDGLTECPKSVLDLTVRLSAELTGTVKTIRDILDLKAGSVFVLQHSADSPIGLSVNGVRFAQGEMVVSGEHFGLRIGEIIAGRKNSEAAS